MKTTERRRHQRTPAHLLALLLRPEQDALLCRVYNLSMAGAEIALDQPRPLSDTFGLVIDGCQVTCRACHVTGTRVGVEFTFIHDAVALQLLLARPKAKLRGRVLEPPMRAAERSSHAMPSAEAQNGGRTVRSTGGLKPAGVARR